MKKRLLFICFAAILCTFNATAQTLTPAPATVENGGTVVLTAENETIFRNITGDISFSNLGLVTTPTGYRIYLSITDLNRTQEYDNLWSKPSKFSFKITNTTQENVTVTIPFKCTLQNSHPDDAGIINTNYIINVTVTVKPTAPTVFYNDAKSQTFFKNDCGTGFESDPVTYSVPANKYSSTISKADANSKAQAEINANGQSKANTDGVCKQVYYNVEMSQSYVKNNCGNGFIGSTELYIVPINKHKSLISQADADSKATNDLNTNGQSFANNSGHCTEERKRYNASKRTTACSSSGQVNLSVWIRIDKNLNNINQNSSSSQVFVYSSDEGNSVVPAGHYTILYPISGSQTGIHVFNVSNTGQITGYTQCSN